MFLVMVVLLLGNVLVCVFKILIIMILFGILEWLVVNIVERLDVVI